MNLGSMASSLVRSIDARAVRRSLVIAIGLLFLANIPAAIAASEADRFFFDHPQARWFLLDAERNIPTLYACVQLACCAGLAILLARTMGGVGRSPTADACRLWVGWALMGLAFAYLTLDEGLSIHESLEEVAAERMALPAWLPFGWVVIAVPIAIVVVALFVPWVRRLPRPTARRMIVGGGLFAFGAVGLETVGGAIVAAQGFGGPAYPIVSSLEELAELVGIAVFLTTLLEHFQTCMALGEDGAGDLRDAQGAALG